MYATLLLSAALAVRTYVPADGAVAVAAAPHERIVQAYSASFDNPWHHADPATRVDRLAAARAGRVEGLAKGHELVVTFVDEDAAPDWTAPYVRDQRVFPYSAQLAAAFRDYGGGEYVAEMTEVAAPSFAGTDRRSAAVCAFHAALEKLRPGTFAAPVRKFGPAAGPTALVVAGLYRRLNPTDRAYGLDGAEIAEGLAAAGLSATVVSSGRIGELAVDDAGYLVYGGARQAYAVFAHLSAHDADELRRMLGTRALKTATYIRDAPMVGHARILFPGDETRLLPKNP